MHAQHFLFKCLSPINCIKLHMQTLKFQMLTRLNLKLSTRGRFDVTKCFVNYSSLFGANMSIMSFFLSGFCVSLQLTDGGKAAKAKMSVGDLILSINGISTDSMNHLEAQNKIKACTDHLSLTLQR